MDPVHQLELLLNDMMSPENETRQEAEKQYESIPLTQRCSNLFQLFLIPTVNAESRSLCLVLLRRILANSWEEVWTSWEPTVQQSFKEQLLLSARTEQTHLLRKRISDVIAEVARYHIDDETVEQKWPEVLKFLHECASSNDEKLKETALVIFESVPGVFGAQQTHYLPVIKEMLSTCLKFELDSEVRTAAVRATTAFICDNEEDDQVLRACQDLVPLVLKICKGVVDAEDDDDIPLQCLGDLATSTPKILRPHLDDICNLCIQTVANKEKEASLRTSALEVLVSLCESSAAMMRKRGVAYVPMIVEQCLSMMVELEDDESWHTADSLNEDEDDNNASVGETSLDRVACALGGKTVMPPCLQKIPLLLGNQTEWKCRHAGLMALSTIAEGCKKSMEPMIEEIVNSMIPFLQDTHPRVRYAACNAFGQMATDFGPSLQKKCHSKVVPGLLMALQDLSNPRVAAHAGAAIVNFSEDCPKHVIVAYLDDIMQKLLFVLEQTFTQLVEAGKKLVLEQIITTIASVADTAEERFVNYYDRVMPCLKYILQHAVQPDYRLLRGKTIECMSLIGLAVGKEKFVSDANEIMQVLLNSQLDLSQMEADDPQISYMISAWARICRLLGQQFAQYLPMVMPAVMKTAEFKPEVTLVDEEEAQSMTEDAEWQFVNLGDNQNFGIRTAGIEDKATACEMLVCYARELKESFVEYVEPVVNLMLPLLKFYFHDGVRSAAAESLSFLLAAGSPKGAEWVSSMWHQNMLPAVLEAIEREHEADVCADFLLSLSKCIEHMATAALTQEETQKVTNVILALIHKHFDKAKERDKRRADEDHDEEQERELEEEGEDDTEVLSRISDVVHALFGVYKEGAIVVFEQLLPSLVQLVQPGRHYSDRQWAICIFDDVIEFGGQNSVKFQSYFLAPMLAALEDRASQVRQAAAYGFGVMGLYGENAYAQACAEAIAPLGRMVEHPESRLTTENISATENAISAVSKILKCNSSMVDANQVLPSFLNWLPVWEDKEEAPHVYGYFADLVESNNPIALGDNNSNLPRIVTIIAEAFKREAFDTDSKKVADRLKNLVRHLQSNADLFGLCMSHLDQEQQVALHNALNT